MEELKKQNEDLKGIILRLLPKRVQDYLNKVKRVNNYYDIPYHPYNCDIPTPGFLEETKIVGVDARVFEGWVKGLYLVVIFNQASIDLYVDGECIKSIPMKG